MDIEIEDIAHGLAFVARWNGQTMGDFAYSVAEHSLLVEALFRRISPKSGPRDLLAALLHDAPEYVVGDMISPFKAAMGIDFKALEERLQNAIHIRFGLPAQLPEKTKKLIKRADLASAYLEAIGIAGFSIEEAQKLWKSPKLNGIYSVAPQAPTEAKAEYLELFESLITAI